MRRRQRSMLAVVAAAVLATAPVRPPDGDAGAATRVTEFSWTASFGSSGPGGTATVRAFASGGGSAVLDLRGLAAGRTYSVGLHRGSCAASGTRIVALGSATASSGGRISRTIALRPSEVALVYGASGGTARASVRLAGGASVRCAALRKTLGATPRIWFAPLLPMPVREGRPYVGSTDVAALFADDALWRRAAGRTHVFKLYGEWLAGTATDADLRRLVSGLERRGIAIAIEVAPLTAARGCGANVEGFGGGPGETLGLISRVEAAGGTVRFLAMDEPYFFGSLYGGPNACRWSRAKVARQVVAFGRAIQRARPGVVVGDIEPLPFGVTASDYEGWIDAYRAAAGAPLPFFHLDLDWTRPDWLAVARRLQEHARAHGVRYGMIYNGHPDDASDAAWIGHAREHFVEFESGRCSTVAGSAGGAVDDAIFQSWHDHPDRVLPESEPTAFTSLIVDYTRSRTSMSVGDPVPGPTGSEALKGSLSSGGGPVAEAAIAGSATPLDGPYQVLELTGFVPGAATTAVVGLRVNHEEAGPGPADLTFYEFAYAEGPDVANRVQNPRFDQGLDRWGWWGDVPFVAVPSDRGTGRMLRVTATAAQRVGLNSQGFAVTPGATYRFTVALRVPAGSVGSAYATVIFLRDTEVARDRLPMAPRAIPLTAGTTDPSGAYLFPLAGLEPGRYQIRLVYAGDRSRWPAGADRTVTVD